jgi:hypothetical protein
MKPQLSQDYNVDGRYTAGKNAVDNDAGKAFLATYINRMREEQKPQYGSDLATEDKFVVNGPGSASYSFRNGFRAKQ